MNCLCLFKCDKTGQIMSLIIRIKTRTIWGSRQQFNFCCALSIFRSHLKHLCAHKNTPVTQESCSMMEGGCYVLATEAETRDLDRDQS